MRIGIGYDVHALVLGRPLVLGGVTIPHDKGLDGHSDADALAHAVADAVLGALGLGDIGRHFPDTDPAYRGADSMELLARVAEKITAAGYRVGNVDATVIAQSPKLAPHVADMEKRLATALGCAAECVNIKATTHEKLGSLGRGEGIAAQAVCLLASEET
ncbi:MAG: 2-C-methyl-D-erythritol 2,4-cyclodiphosphate synthase [Leptospirillia bacterium]